MGENGAGSWIPRQGAGVDYEVELERLVLRHPQRGWVLTLNDAAALIWQLCDGRRSAREIESLLREAYPGRDATVVADTRIAFGQLLGVGALEAV